MRCHGGPTGSGGPTYTFEYQYWTSRGFAVVDVNYGGSSGYGRAYRVRLNGNWGVVDVDDCINAARYLVEQGVADRNRVSITGGSAGGFTVLLSLAHRDSITPAPAICMETLICSSETHKSVALRRHVVGPTLSATTSSGQVALFRGQPQMSVISFNA